MLQFKSKRNLENILSCHWNGMQPNPPAGVTYRKVTESYLYLGTTANMWVYCFKSDFCFTSFHLHKTGIGLLLCFGISCLMYVKVGFCLLQVPLKKVIISVELFIGLKCFTFVSIIFTKTFQDKPEL